jgi:hypothetical protein
MSKRTDNTQRVGELAKIILKRIQANQKHETNRAQLTIDRPKSEGNKEESAVY